MKYILALDQGTTSSRAALIDASGRLSAMAQKSFPQHYPQPGWVEHDPDDILGTELAAADEVLASSGISPGDIEAIGITNQRETTLVWDRRTGRPLCSAIVWQCRRTADICEKLEADGVGGYVREKTGLLLDAYFSGTKLKWILDNVPGVRGAADRGDALFGTVESYLIWHLTGGKAHVTDYSNASRTMLFDIDNLRWDGELARVLGIPLCMLPQPVPTIGCLGHVEKGALAGIPICAAAGDQAAALFGQCCFDPGSAKNTYGTGCFTLLNSGELSVRSPHGLLTSVFCSDGHSTEYALEGSAFNAGSAIQWLRDELGLIRTARECDELAESVPDALGAVFVPAFTGLGAPYWDMYARGTLCNLTRGTTRAHIARAVLESIAYQVSDLAAAMALDSGHPLSGLRVDGGASVSNVLMQFQADMLGVPVDRPACVESTALGAAFMAGLGCGLWSSRDELRRLRHTERVFSPVLPVCVRSEKLLAWKKAVARARLQ